MAQLLPDVVFRLLDSSANPISGGTATFYLSGTSTLTPIYSDSGLTAALPNPISTNSGGLFINGSNAVTAIYLDDTISYRAVFKDATGTTVRDIDPVYASLTTPPYGTRTQLTAVSIAASWLTVVTSGFSTAGVGSASYVRKSLADITAGPYPAASYFRSLDRYMPNGSTDATNGGYWLLTSLTLTPPIFGGVGDGSSETTVFQAIIDYATAAGLTSATVNGTYTFGTLTGGSDMTWFLDPGSEVTPGKLPGRVVLAAPPTFGPPQSVWVFGARGWSTEVTVTSADLVGPSSASGDKSVTVNGICSNDLIVAGPLIDDFSDGLSLLSYGDGGRNTFTAKFWNLKTAGNLTINSRRIPIQILGNPAYREVFALSLPQGKDCWFAGVNMESVKSACIWKTNNAGSSWVAKAALSANAIRSFVEITANSNSSLNDTLNTVMLATVSDANTATELAWRTTDGWATFAAITFTLSGSNAESLLFEGDVEGGQGNGSGTSYVILGSFRGGNAPGTIFVSTDGGATFPGSPIEVAPATTYDSVWGVKWISGVGAASVWLAFVHRNDATTLAPAVYRSADGGATWTLLTTVGAVGNEWQGIIRLDSGTLLAGLDSADGGIFRSIDNGATWTQTFACAGVVSADGKARCFTESLGSIYMGTQDSGHIWRSDDDGLTWVCEWRLAQQAAPVCISASSAVMLVGCSQGYTTSTSRRAEIYRLVRAPYRNQYG